MPNRPRYDSPPHLTISITDTCNLRCRWCYGDCAGKRADAQLATSEWIGFLDYLVEHGFIQVYFEGGEPFLRPDFLDILAHCTPRLMTFVRTNGTLVTPSLAAQLKRIGVGRMLVDIQGSTAEVHDGLTGVAGSFEKACAAIRRLVAEDIKTDALVILNRENAAQIQEIAELASWLGARRLGVLRLYPLGRARRAWPQLSMTLQDQDATIANLRAPEGFEIMQSWHPRDRNCCWQAAAVTAKGDSVGCMYLREYVNYGNIRSTTLLETWRTHPLYRELREGSVRKSCGDCHSNDGTHGGCRSTAYAFSGRWDAPDPFCTHLNEGVDLRELPPLPPRA